MAGGFGHEVDGGVAHGAEVVGVATVHGEALGARLPAGARGLAGPDGVGPRGGVVLDPGAGAGEELLAVGGGQVLPEVKVLSHLALEGEAPVEVHAVSPGVVLLD